MSVSNRGKWSVLLVDDDPIFRRIIEAVAGALRVEVTSSASWKEAATLLRSRAFDVAILDCYLGDHADGVKVAAILDDTPAILVSNTDRCGENEAWPDAIKRFVSKRRGVRGILEIALSVGRQNRKRKVREPEEGKSERLLTPRSAKSPRPAADSERRDSARLLLAG